MKMKQQQELFATTSVVYAEQVERLTSSWADAQKALADANMANTQALESARDVASPCASCLRDRANVLIQHCKHACLCVECHERGLFVSCPICRGPVDDIIRFYTA